MNKKEFTQMITKRGFLNMLEHYHAEKNTLQGLSNALSREKQEGAAIVFEEGEEYISIIFNKRFFKVGINASTNALEFHF